MKRPRPALLFLTAALLWGSGAPALAQDESATWDPKKTWVFAVGILEWQDEAWGKFPKKESRGHPESELSLLDHVV